MKKILIKAYGLLVLPVGSSSVQVHCPTSFPYSEALETYARAFKIAYEVVDTEVVAAEETKKQEPQEVKPAEQVLTETTPVDDTDAVLDNMTKLAEEAEDTPPSMSDILNMKKKDLIDLAARYDINFEGSRNEIIDRLRKKFGK